MIVPTIQSIQKFIEEQYEFATDSNNFALGILTKKMSCERPLVLKALARKLGDWDLVEKINKTHVRYVEEAYGVKLKD